MLRIKIISNDQNKDNGFYTLINSGYSIACLKDDVYIVPKEAINKLNARNIKWELVNEEI